MLIDQVLLDDILAQADRLGLRLVAGSAVGVPVTRVEIAALDTLETMPPEALVIAAPFSGRDPSPYQFDIAVRQAVARGFTALVVTGGYRLPDTARLVADRAGMPVLSADTRSASELGVVLDRIVRGGAAEALARAEFAIAEVGAAAASRPASARDAILGAASRALGTELVLDDRVAVEWTQPDAVCIGEVPVGRLTASSTDHAVQLAIPVIASILSRALQQELRDRYAPIRSRADLILELLFAESARVDGFAAEAARLGLPLQLSHVVGWLRPTHVADSEARPPAALQSSLELYALQLVDGRPEEWHVATWHDDVVLVASEEHGAGDHQRRLRDVAEDVRDHAGVVAGADWVYTLGLGTPQVGPSGLRQSAAEARVSAESAIAAGRAGTVQVTDVTGLRRVLFDFYASPLSRRLLDDVLAPLDALGPERAATAVQTLLAYLGHRNSLVRAGQELTLHPNAVNYRIRRIEQTLGLDLDDPDNRFALELACRVRSLGTQRR